jgi:hypothetical protein
MRVLVGTQFYAGHPDAMRRQASCAASLTALREADAVNIQWRDERYDRPDVETLPLLDRDAAGVAGIAGRRLPIVADLLDALARTAFARGLRYAAFINSDIIVTQAAIDRIRGEGRQTYAFSRMDIDPPSGAELSIVHTGIDAFVVDVAWWREHQHRFRSYVLGQPCFDNVFTAIMMAHSADGIVVNRAGEIRHEWHPMQSGGPYARYNFYLAALDAPYFTLWAHYIAALEAMRQRNAPAEAEEAMVRRVFVWRQSPFAAIWHAGRCARARWRYARDRGRLIESAGAAPR